MYKNRIDARFSESRGELYDKRFALFEEEALRVQEMSSSEFEDFVRRFTFAKPEMATILERLLPTIGDAGRVRKLLAKGWFMVEMSGSQDLYLRAFRLARVVNIDFFGQESDSTSIDEPLEIFRGCIPGFERRLSWTTLRCVAEYFAVRNATHASEVAGAPGSIVPEVWRAVAEPATILGISSAENEVVVDYEAINPSPFERLDPETSLGNAVFPKQFMLDRPVRWTAH